MDQPDRALETVAGEKGTLIEADESARGEEGGGEGRGGRARDRAIAIGAFREGGSRRTSRRVARSRKTVETARHGGETPRRAYARATLYNHKIYLRGGERGKVERFASNIRFALP